MSQIILGVSAFYHDSAAALLVDGHLIAAAQEERFSRVKHDLSFPSQAIQYCLAEASIDLSQVDEIIFYEDTWLKFTRLLATHISYAPKGFDNFLKAMSVWLGGKICWRRRIKKNLRSLLHDANNNLTSNISHVGHHASHAASVFYPSPFQRALVLCLDGVGEWDCVSVWMGNGAKLTKLKSIHFPHSLGLLYSAFTYYLGFSVNSGEYKLMGLAPYGEPTFVDLIKEHLIDIKSDGSYRLKMSYFDFPYKPLMINKKFETLFGGERRQPKGEISQRHLDIARSIQVVTEEIVLAMTNDLYNEYGHENLCLSGGVALNCVANSRIQKESPFKKIWVQPAAGDAGGALGAALLGHYINHPFREVGQKKSDSMQGAYLGPEFDKQQIANFLTSNHIPHHTFSTTKQLTAKVSQMISNGKIVGWFQGRMEFGPRALGARSILADPRSVTMQSELNLKVKFRESFRPFAPAVLAEFAKDWFNIKEVSPYMLFVADVNRSKQYAVKENTKQCDLMARLGQKRSDIPAVTHVDFSARVQTVHKETNPIFHQLLSSFYDLTGCPVLINTSFNVNDEPIVCSPSDAYNCFMHTKIDILVLGRHLLYKTEQPTTDKTPKK